MEVIARKKSGLLWLYIFCTVLGGIAVLAACAFILRFGLETIVPDIILIIGGVVMAVTGLVITINISITPEIIIVYENGKLKCGGTEFLPSEILNVEYRCAHARGISYKWGKIKIILRFTTISYDYVAEVEQAHNRLIQLMLESRQ